MLTNQEASGNRDDPDGGCRQCGNLPTKVSRNDEQ